MALDVYRSLHPEHPNPQPAAPVVAPPPRSVRLYDVRRTLTRRHISTDTPIHQRSVVIDRYDTPTFWFESQPFVHPRLGPAPICLICNTDPVSMFCMFCGAVIACAKISCCKQYFKDFSQHCHSCDRIISMSVGSSWNNIMYLPSLYVHPQLFLSRSASSSSSSSSSSPTPAPAPSADGCDCTDDGYPHHFDVMCANCSYWYGCRGSAVRQLRFKNGICTGCHIAAPRLVPVETKIHLGVPQPARPLTIRPMAGPLPCPATPMPQEDIDNFRCACCHFNRATLSAQPCNCQISCASCAHRYMASKSNICPKCGIEVLFFESLSDRMNIFFADSEQS